MSYSDLYLRIKEAAIGKAQGLSLAGMTRFYNQANLDPTDMEFPCLVVSSEGEQEQILGGDTESVEKVYPVRMFVMDRMQEKGELKQKEAKYSSIRSDIIDAFSQQFLPGVPEVYGCVVNPAVIFDAKQSEYQFFVSGCVLMFSTWQPRPSKANRGASVPA